ncbi:MAG: MFS transporter [Acutalibacteraceae bacterium]|nr:MFS transporter [Acutalibacteraceae bacterium]
MLSYTYTKIASYIGYVVQAIACSFLPLLFVAIQNTYNINYEKLGRLILVCFVTQIFVDLISIKLLKIFGYRPLILASQAFAAVGFILLGILPKIIPAYIGITIAVIIYSIGSGLIEVIISPIVEYLPTKNKSGNMALLHSFFCWGNVFVVLGTTIMIRLLGEENWNIIAFIWAIIPAIVFAMFLFAPIVEPEASTRTSIKGLIKKPAFILMLVIMFLAGAGEISVGNWMSAFAEQALGLPKLVGDIAGPCLFSVCMGLGRVLFSFIGDKAPMRKVLFCFAVFTSVAYLVLSLSENKIICLVAGSLVGFGVSVMWPGSLSMSASKFPTGAASMFAILAMFGDLGCSFGPWMTGLIADYHNLNIAFLCASGFPILMAIILFITNRKKVKQ